MSDSQDPKIWMQFATENMLVARIGLENQWLKIAERVLGSAEKILAAG